MRIQHNILAMNSYRNYSNNTTALSRNLEKLSSGYKINRAGDDAAGLAISEKMRAQIQGLSAAQKNVKDGISFVKTAEGAMQEIQDMLSRMKYLATQSANGTYQNDVDRQALQDEVDSLLTEIDRIAQSSNFNDIHMLNGPDPNSDSSTDPALAIEKTNGSVATDPTITKATFKLDLSGVSATINDSYTLTISGQTVTSETASGTAGTDIAAAFDGKQITINSVTYDITADGAELTFTETGDGAATDGNNVTALTDGTSVSLAASVGGNTVNGAASLQTAGASDGTWTAPGKNPAKTELDFSDLTGADVIGKTVTIGGTTYEFVAAAADVTGTNTAVVVAEADAGADIASALETALTGGNGNTTTIGNATFNVGTNGATLTLEEATPAGTTAAPEVKTTLATTDDEDGEYFTINLQIGDSKSDYNRMEVKIQSMRITSLKIDGLEKEGIDTAPHALDAIETIKDAINTVSSVRGQLGAYQNRLEHTQNNLSVMAENIQDAESTIRDTDVADEMMGYVKNNILVQSAQAMLAQANQVPQGVLQLLG